MTICPYCGDEAYEEILDVGSRFASIHRTTHAPRYVGLRCLKMIPFKYNDGGRSELFKGTTRDCVVRAIAIAAELQYQEVYHQLSLLSNNAPGRAGVFKVVFKPYIESLGFAWHPCMQIGSGCKVHLSTEELPAGRLIVRLSKHLAAVVDGVLLDTNDCSRGGKRCVYGYWIKE